MRSNQNRPWQFPPNADRFLPGKKDCKRPVYNCAYCLLTSAYFVAYIAAYLPFTGRAGNGFLSQIRLIVRLENIASPGASWRLFQNL
jgi:hypothetical protein